MRSIRLLIAVATAITATTLTAGPASAAVPSNDLSSGALAVSIPFNEVRDTREATSGAEEVELGFFCGGWYAYDASVWYSFVGTGGDVLVDTTGSSYFAAIILAVGSPGNLTAVNCSDQLAKLMPTEAGVTYYLVAFDAAGDLDGSIGGDLSIALGPAPPAPTIEITVNRKAQVDNKTGAAYLGGTYTCTDAPSFDSFFIGGNLTQNVGRLVTIHSQFGLVGGLCDGQSWPWSVEAVPDSGKFRGGQGRVVIDARVCDQYDRCAFDSTRQTVQLRVSG